MSPGNNNNIESTQTKCDEDEDEFDSYNETDSYKVTSQMDEEDQGPPLDSQILNSSAMNNLDSVPNLDASQEEDEDPDMSSPFRELPSKSPLFMSTGKLRGVHREQRRDRIQSSMSGALTDSENSVDEINVSDDFMNIPPPPVFEKVSPWRKSKTQSRNRPTLQLTNATLSSVVNDTNNTNNLSDIFSSVHIHDEKSVNNLNGMENIQKELTNCKIQLRLQSELLRERFGEEAQLGLFEAFEQKFSDNFVQPNLQYEEVQKQLNKERDMSSNLRSQLEEFTSLFEELDNDTKKLYEERDSWDNSTSRLTAKLIALIDDDGLKSILIELHTKPFSLEKLDTIGTVIEKALDLLKFNNRSLLEEMEGRNNTNAVGQLSDELAASLESFRIQREEFNQLKLSFSQEIEKNQELLSKIESLKNEMKLAQQEKEDVNVQHKKLGEDLTKLQEKHVEATKRIISLESRDMEKVGSAATASGKVTDALKIENKELLQETEALKLGYDNLANKIKESENKRQKLQDLVNELSKNKDPDSSSQRSLTKRVTELENELSQSSTKQRSLTSDKAKLQADLRKLREESSLEENELKQEIQDLAKSLWDLDSNYNKIIQRDVNLSTHMLESFRHILDDESVKDTANKVVQLAKKDNLKLNQKEVHIIHESISEYLLLGTRTIVEAYMEQDTSNTSIENDSAKVDKLEQIIYRLRLENSELRAELNSESRVVAAGPLTPARNSIINSSSSTLSSSPSSSSQQQQALPIDTGSPRTRFRLDALNKRWKAAQEALVYERRESNRRLEQLSDENGKLRQLLRANNIPY